MTRRPPKALAICLACSLISLAPFLRAGATEDGENIVETFDVSRDGSALLVPVALGDRNYDFLVDTGTTFSIVDPALESYLTPAPGTGFAQINGKGREKRYYIDRARVGKSRQPLSGKALCLDLTAIREACGHNIRGILGMDFLKSRLVRIDFGAGQMSFLKSVSAPAGAEFRIWRNKLDQPVLLVLIADDDSAPFIVDTGLIGFAASLSKSRFDKLATVGRVQPDESIVRTADLNEATEHRAGRLDKFIIGDLAHERITVVESEQNKIGLDLLSRYVVTFDFPNNRLYLNPRTEQARRATE